MKMTMELKGGDELSRGLKALALPEELETIRLAALMAAGEPIRDAVKLEAPFDEGRLFTAVELDNFVEATRMPTRSSMGIWIDSKGEYRALKTPKAFKKRRPDGRTHRDYQTGSIPIVYGAILNFAERFRKQNGWFKRGWDAEGGDRAVWRAWRSLHDSLIDRIRRRLSGR